MTLAANFMAPGHVAPAPIPVMLDYPIPVPGGDIAKVRVHSLDRKHDVLAQSGDFEDEITSLAFALNLPREVVLELDDADYDRIIEAQEQVFERDLHLGRITPLFPIVGGTDHEH